MQTNVLQCLQKLLGYIKRKKEKESIQSRKHLIKRNFQSTNILFYF